MSPAANILVVDDEPAILEVCRRTLETPERRVVTALTGAEGLSLFGSGDYDVVLTDLRMPGSVDGLAVFEEVKRRAPGTGVIIMTGYPALDTAIPTLKDGACDYLMKPFDQDHLRSAVAQCINNRGRFQEMEELQEAFMARVNHELRGPMAPTFMALEQLRESSTTSKSQVLCGLLEEQLRRLQEAVNQVLLFSDLKRAGYRCPLESVNMREVLEKIIIQHYTLWEEKGLAVQVDWPQQVESQLGNPELIEMAYKQLFLNAVRFNRPGGEIRIQARREDSTIEVVFADTGIGIPAGQLPHIFDSFYQAADPMTRRTGGMGLGLSLVKRIAELHGGSVRVESREAEGSVFTLTLPG